MHSINNSFILSPIPAKKKEKRAMIFETPQRTYAHIFLIIARRKFIQMYICLSCSNVSQQAYEKFCEHKAINRFLINSIIHSQLFSKLLKKQPNCIVRYLIYETTDYKIFEIFSQKFIPKISQYSYINTSNKDIF